jgi:N-acetylmuramoyl-L-alanine amidase
MLVAKGYKVYMTRVEDTAPSLQDRVDLSEASKPDVFVSVHVNASVKNDISGVETHWYHDYSNEFAQTVHKHLVKNIPTNDRGLFKSQFYVINHTTVPAILVEMGFLSNDAERAMLVTDKRKQQVAKSVVDGIVEYINARK